MLYAGKELSVATDLARRDLYVFTRLMFKARKNFKWQHAEHHRIICDALMRVFHGECPRLIINIPPRYSKTELAVVNFIPWALGHFPDSEFIHVSYAGDLAANNASQARDIVQHQLFREIFPDLALRTDRNASDHWKTTAGGVVYARGEGGAITGFGAGKARDGFGGCFPVGTRVWTERGALPIDRIVRERMAVNVWAHDGAGSMALRPVTAWHENPPNAIVRVTFDDGATVECTPDHRFWTEGRGWIRADSLCENDRLPRVRSGIKGGNDVAIDTEQFCCWSDAEPIFPVSAIGAVGERDFGLRLGQNSAQIASNTTLIDDRDAAGYGPPGIATPNLVNDRNADTVSLGEIGGGDANSIVNSERLRIGQDCIGMDFSLAERPMPFAVENVPGSTVITQIVEPVIRGVAISVANIGSNGALADKGAHDEHVHEDSFDLACDGKINPQMSACFARGAEYFSGLNIASTGSGVRDLPILTFNPAEITDGIKPFVAGHRTPVLVEYVRHDEATFCLTVEEYHNFVVEEGLVVKNCIVLDDPHKADEARSDHVRKGVIEWFQNTLESRKNDPKRTPIIVIMQRLHEEDLAGWLLAGGNGEQWEHICLPALRSDGTSLWPEKHSVEMLRRMEEATPYNFAGQYQQRPSPLAGGVFKPDKIDVIDAAHPGTRWMRGWDLAGTQDGGDYTAGALIGQQPDGSTVIGDMQRIQGGPERVEALIVATAKRDGLRVRISFPQDPGQAGKMQAAYFVKSLSGFPARTSPESGDKITRAEPFAAQVNVGNVKMVRGEWNAAMIHELRNFPNGKYDDQVDACSRAFNELALVGAGMKVSPLRV